MPEFHQRIDRWRTDVQPGKPARPRAHHRGSSAPPTIYANDSISVVASRPYMPPPPRPVPIPVPGSSGIHSARRAATIKRPIASHSNSANSIPRSPPAAVLPPTPPVSSANPFSRLFGRLKSPNTSRSPSANRGVSPSPARSPAPPAAAAPLPTQPHSQQQYMAFQYPGSTGAQPQYYTVMPNGSLSPGPVSPGGTAGYFYQPVTPASIPPVQNCPACRSPVLTAELHHHLRAHGWQI